MKDKLKVGCYVIAIVAGLQLYAWHTGHDGQVFAFTSLVIGAIAGTMMGFTYSRLPKK